MMEIIGKILVNVLDAIYKPFGYAILTSVLLMFLYLYIKDVGVKQVLRKWINSFQVSAQFRKLFVLSFYTIILLFRTLFNRNIWANPISNVIGIWGIYDEKGVLTTETIENFILFMPFIFLLFWCFRKEIIGQSVKFIAVIKQSLVITFLFSLTTELLQLVFRIGTFQLSDLFYNTLGGFIGGLIYWIAYKITHRKK